MGPRGEGVSYERGTPVHVAVRRPHQKVRRILVSTKGCSFAHTLAQTLFLSHPLTLTHSLSLRLRSGVCGEK